MATKEKTQNPPLVNSVAQGSDWFGPTQAPNDSMWSNAVAGTVKGAKHVADQPPTTQMDINKILQPYINEMTNLGPEYSAEMEYLKPYLEGTGAAAPQTFQQLEAGSKADETPTGSAKVNEADQSAGTALENQQPPGFGALASAAKQYEGTLPYSDILQTVLGAGKNEILYGTTPNLSTIETTGWPDPLQQAYKYLVANATGDNPTTGFPTPKVAAKTAPSGAKIPGATGTGGGNG